MDGKVGIIHLDRHVDTQEKDMDEIMHTCPWFHTTNMPNCPPGQPGAVGDRRLAGPSFWRDGGTRARHHVPDCRRDREDRVDKTIEIGLQVALKGAPRML